jgi:hypothetical protein
MACNNNVFYALHGPEREKKHEHECFNVDYGFVGKGRIAFLLNMLINVKILFTPRYNISADADDDENGIETKLKVEFESS